jgi:hypothetical protein
MVAERGSAPGAWSMGIGLISRPFRRCVRHAAPISRRQVIHAYETHRVSTCKMDETGTQTAR